MAQSFHMHIRIRSLLAKDKRKLWKDWKYVFTDDNGKTLSVEEIKNWLMDELAKGHEVYPCGECDNFDYSGRGCLGHEKSKSGNNESPLDPPFASQGEQEQ